MSKHGKSTYSIQSVDHAIDLLEQFCAKDAELGVTDLSRRMKLPKNKVFRLLSTLKAKNFVEQNQQSENYRLGYKVMELRQTVVRHLRPLEYWRPLLEALARECNETICYSVLDNFDVVTIDKYECSHALRASPQIGALLPSYCTSAGKAMLATMKEEVVEQHLSSSRFMKHTPHTITDPDKLRQQLQEIARRGYAVGTEEMEIGVRSVGVVIRDHSSRTVGAISLLGPCQRLDDKCLNDKLIPLMLETAAELSAKLGYCEIVEPARPKITRIGREYDNSLYLPSHS